MIKRLDTLLQGDRVFAFLVIFRWATLLPALLTVNLNSRFVQLLSPTLILGIALLVNIVITLTNHQLSKLVVDRPAFLGIDLIFTAGILVLSGGSHSPYYLYALSPLLAGAFFFQIRGALTLSLIFTPLYLTGNFFNPQIDLVVMATQLAGIWLIPILFAYPSILLKDISQAREELTLARDELTQKHDNLTNAHRQLEIIHDLTVLLQAAPDLISVQERVLGAVTTDLGFSKAVVAMVDPALEEIGGWMVYPIDASFPKTQSLPLKSENGDVIKALLNRTNMISSGQTLIQDSQLNNWLNQYQWFVVPLFLREHPVGVLLVEESGKSENLH